MPKHFQDYNRALSHPNFSYAPEMGSCQENGVAAATTIYSPVARDNVIDATADLFVQWHNCTMRNCKSTVIVICY